jgi:hypothetical protein
VTEGREASDSPRFSRVLFGYDRNEVEDLLRRLQDYVNQLQEWASESHARAEEAERQAAEQDEEIRQLRIRLGEPVGEVEGEPADVSREESQDGGPPGMGPPGRAPEEGADAQEAPEPVPAEAGYAEAGYAEAGYAEAGYGEGGYGEAGYGEAGYGETDTADGAPAAAAAPGGERRRAVEQILADLTGELERFSSALQRLEQDLGPPRT